MIQDINSINLYDDDKIIFSKIDDPKVALELVDRLDDLRNYEAD